MPKIGLPLNANPESRNFAVSCVRDPALQKEKKEPLAWALIIVLTTMLMGNNIFTKVTLLFCLIYFGVKNIREMPEIFSALRHNPSFLLLQLWAGFSILWSVVPVVTRDIVSVQSVFFCLCVLMARYSVGKNIDQSLKLVTFFVITVVALYVLLYPSEAISQKGFKAFYANKNGLGTVMAACLLIILCSYRPKWMDYGFAAIAFALLLLSRSKTSISLFGIILIIFLFNLLFKKWYGQISGFAKGMLHLFGKGVLGLMYSAIFALIVFRDVVAAYLIAILPYDFLTGRGELWVMVLKRTEIDLLHGIGPGSFWGAGRLSEIAQTSLLSKHPLWIEKLGSADGGYIDLVGALGFIGLALLLLSFVSNFRRLLQISSVPTSGVAMALISLFILHNITETTAYHSTNFLWFLYLYFSFYLIFLSRATTLTENASDKKSEPYSYQGLNAKYE